MNTFTQQNSYQQKQQKPRTKSATFSQPVAKSDVGEFQDGCFVMVETPQPNIRNKNYHPRSAETSPSGRPKSEMLQGRPAYRENSSTFHHPHPTHYASQQDGETNVSNERFTSPSRSPNRRRSPHSKGGIDATSPNKPRRAQEYPVPVERTEGIETRGGSPPKGTSPAPSRWAGPAFSKAPPPSSLPIPDFPPFSSPSDSPSTSPSPSPPQQSSPPVAASYLPYFYQATYSLPPAPQYTASYSYVPAPSLDQLSMDLRRMLHIEQPVHPIYA